MYKVFFTLIFKKLLTKKMNKKENYQILLFFNIIFQLYINSNKITDEIFETVFNYILSNLTLENLDLYE